MRLAVFFHFLCSGRLTLFKDDKEFYFFTAFRVGDADGAAFLYLRITIVDLVDIAGVDVVAARDDHVFHTVDDVKITKELYEYALKNNHLKYKDLGAGGTIHDIKFDTSKWQTAHEHAMNFTLPF